MSKPTPEAEKVPAVAAEAEAAVDDEDKAPAEEEKALVDTEKVEVIRPAGVAELSPATTWTGLPLDAPFVAHLTDVLKWARPSHVQAVTLPYLFSASRYNMKVQSDTGTGKTGVFALTMLCHLDADVAAPQAVVVVPTKELAMQHASKIGDMAKAYNPKISVRLVTGGITYSSKLHDQIIIGTVGQLENMFKKKLIDASTVETFIVDEADHMLGSNASDLQRCYAHCKGRATDKKTLQTIFVSATFSGMEAQMASYMGAEKAANRIDVKVERGDAKNVTHLLVRVPGPRDDAKMALMLDIWRRLPALKAIDFCRSAANVHGAHGIAKRTGDSALVAAVAGRDEEGKTTGLEKRAVIISRMNRGEIRLLITTDLYSRGVDFPALGMVVNLDVPSTATAYRHRAGRVGRLKHDGTHARGVVLNVVCSDEEEKHFTHILTEDGRAVVKSPCDAAKLIDAINDALDDSSAPAPAPTPAAATGGAGAKPAVGGGGASGGAGASS